MAFLDSERGTGNVALADPTGVFEASPRGTANVTLADPPVSPGVFDPSGRGTANITLSNAVQLPEGWQRLSTQQRVGGVWRPAILTQAGSQLQVIQFVPVPDPPVDPVTLGPSARGTANVTLGGTWAKPLIGVIGSSESTFNSINSQIGGGTCRRTYNTTLPVSWATSAAASDVAAGRMSYWSWKPTLTTFPTNTAAKNAFSAFLDTIPAGHECVIMAWHEPENDISPGDYTLVQWGALQNAVAEIVKSKGRPNIRTGFCLMGPWTFDTRSGRAAWDWEGAVDFSLIDVVGIDPYRTTAGSTMTLETMLTVKNSGSNTGPAGTPSMMEKLVSWGKPVSLMEWGAYYAGDTVDPTVPTFIADAYDWFKRWNQAHPLTPIESALWYSMTILSPPEDTPLTGAEITAYAAIVADSKIPV